MRDPKKITDAGKSLLIEIIQRMALRPKLLDVKFFESVGAIQFQIVAHPNDAQIMVGNGGVRLDALASMARLLFFGAYRNVQAMTVLSIDGCAEIPHFEYAPDENWPEHELNDFAGRLATACFPYSDVAVKCTTQDAWSSIMEITLEPPPHDYPLGRFTKAMSPIMFRIGEFRGQKLYVQVNPKNNADDTTRTTRTRS